MNAAEVIAIKSWNHVRAKPTPGVLAQEDGEGTLSSVLPAPIMQAVYLLLCLQILNSEEQSHGLTAKGKVYMQDVIRSLDDETDQLVERLNRPEGRRAIDALEKILKATRRRGARTA